MVDQSTLIIINICVSLLAPIFIAISHFIDKIVLSDCWGVKLRLKRNSSLSNVGSV